MKALNPVSVSFSSQTQDKKPPTHGLNLEWYVCLVRIRLSWSFQHVYPVLTLQIWFLRCFMAHLLKKFTNNQIWWFLASCISAAETSMPSGEYFSMVLIRLSPSSHMMTEFFPSYLSVLLGPISIVPPTSLLTEMYASGNWKLLSTCSYPRDEIDCFQLFIFPTKLLNPSLRYQQYWRLAQNDFSRSLSHRRPWYLRTSSRLFNQSTSVSPLIPLLFSSFILNTLLSERDWLLISILKEWTWKSPISVLDT